MRLTFFAHDVFRFVVFVFVDEILFCYFKTLRQNTKNTMTSAHVQRSFTSLGSDSSSSSSLALPLALSLCWRSPRCPPHHLTRKATYPPGIERTPISRCLLFYFLFPHIYLLFVKNDERALVCLSVREQREPKAASVVVIQHLPNTCTSL